MKKKEFNKDREFSVVLEGLRSDFRIFGEGLTMLREKVGSIDGILSILTGKITALELRVTRLENK